MKDDTLDLFSQEESPKTSRATVKSAPAKKTSRKTAKKITLKEEVPPALVEVDTQVSPAKPARKSTKKVVAKSAEPAHTESESTAVQETAPTKEKKVRAKRIAKSAEKPAEVESLENSSTAASVADKKEARASRSKKITSSTETEIVAQAPAGEENSKDQATPVRRNSRKKAAAEPLEPQAPAVENAVKPLAPPPVKGLHAAGVTIPSKITPPPPILIPSQGTLPQTAPLKSESNEPPQMPPLGLSDPLPPTQGQGNPRRDRRSRWAKRREEERSKRLARHPHASPGNASLTSKSPQDENSAAQPQSLAQSRARFERPPRPELPPAPPEICNGYFEGEARGFGFLRKMERNFAPLQSDVYVSQEFVRKYGLRPGHHIEGQCRRGPRGPQLIEITKINGENPDDIKNHPLFDELKAVNPTKRWSLETEASKLSTRVIDMFSPIGRGQRGLIVAPPRTGKTTLLQNIAEALLHNHEDTVHLIIVLIDERPEEVTEFRRAFPNVEIFASSNDSDIRVHPRVAEFAINRAKRLVEAGKHVFILLDSITRLSRAYNNSQRGGGKTMSGGIDSRALEMPRRLFAAARNTREAGSLTIVATALIETNNKGDDLIFQEFKGTGNMELVLDRRIAEHYIYPAMDIFRSGTRREELLLPPNQLEKIQFIRRGLSGHKPMEAMERMLHVMGKFPSNAQMLIDIKKGA